MMRITFKEIQNAGTQVVYSSDEETSFISFLSLRCHCSSSLKIVIVCSSFLTMMIHSSQDGFR